MNTDTSLRKARDVTVEKTVSGFMLSFALVLVSETAPAQSNVWILNEGQHPQFVETDNGQRKIHLLLFLPKGYTERKWPLLVFLHSGIAGGSDLKLLDIPGTPPRNVAAQPDFPFIVASPQQSFESTKWSSADVAYLVDELVNRLPIDSSRIYLTGASRGGSGAWSVAADHPQRFAAVAPISSKPDPESVCQLKGVPVWAFHNKGDFVTDPKHVQLGVERLRACGGTVELTIYPQDGHNAWSSAYANPDLYKWLLSHSRK